LSQQDAFYAEIGRRVRGARERAGLTQEALAARVGLSRTSLTNIERGRQKMLLHTLCGIAQATGVKPARLLPDVLERANLPSGEEGVGEQALPDVSVMCSRNARGGRRAQVV
jgi:transcriptional regulator with XRE-family HTH domain